jgi:hypothetical protein
MHILASVNAHIRKPKCTYTEELSSIYAHFGFVYAHLRKEKMHIYGSQNAHIRKRASVYVHFGFVNAHIWNPKCAYMEEDKIHIYGRELSYMRILVFPLNAFYLPYMRILASANAHKCAYTEAKMCIYGSSIYGRELPYMRILASVNAHIQKLSSIYAHFVFCKCAFWLPYMHIFSSVYAHFVFRICAFTEAIMRI